MSSAVPPLVGEILDALDVDSTHRDVHALLRAQAWTPCGEGDWAIALRSPDGKVVARISPFDPVGPYTCMLYEEALPTELVPRLFGHRVLAGGGHLQLMESLSEVPVPEAESFLRRLHDVTQGTTDAELAELASIVARVHDRARRDLPWCGPLDQNPSNVMRTREGRIVLADPYFAEGPALYETASEDPDCFVASLPEEQRRYMTEIPLTESGPWSATDREAMAEGLRQADARRARWQGARAAPRA